MNTWVHRFVFIAVCVLAGAALLAAPIQTRAGAACVKRALTPDELVRASEIALKLRDLLDVTPHDAAIVARVGSDVSRYGLKYTHMGLLFRNHPKGRWLFAHVLNHCGTDEAELYDEGLINFFTDDPLMYDALVVVPSKDLQAGLQRIVFSTTGRGLHTSRYSTIAHPFSERYVNSSHWIMAMIAAAQALPRRLHTKQAVFAELALNGFSGAEVALGGLERLFAGLFRPNIKFDDHSEDEHASGRFRTITARSVVEYLERTDGLLLKTELRLPEARRFNPHKSDG